MSLQLGRGKGDSQILRDLTISDDESLKEIFFHSFPKEEAPQTLNIISQIVRETSQPSPVCLGFEEQGHLVGAIANSPVYFDADPQVSAYILAPLAVHNSHQKKGIATQLIEASKARLGEKGVDVLLVYGDPSYYGRYGFDLDLAKRFVPPYPLQFEFGWQAVKLSSRDIANARYEFRCVDALSDAALW